MALITITKVKMIFAWYDFWIGLFWDRTKKRLYIFPVPCFGVLIDFGDSDFNGNVHFRDAGLEPLCGTMTVGDADKVTCPDCLLLLSGKRRGIDNFRD